MGAIHPKMGATHPNIGLKHVETRQKYINIGKMRATLQSNPYDRMTSFLLSMVLFDVL